MMAEAVELLQVSNLRKSFQPRGGFLRKSKATVHAVDGVSFDLKAGETLGLVGESGSGKSTLGRLVLRLLDPDSGSVRLNGRELTTLTPEQVRAVRSDIQMVFQDPYGSLDPRKTVEATLAEPLRVHGLWNTDSPQLIVETMRRVGLNPDHASRYPHQFSGGQRQRIGIARALMLNPKVLVLDEPVSALDVSIQAQIINLLKKIQRERDLAYIFVAHDLAVVRHVSDRVAVLYLGKIVELATRNDLYDRPAHPYTEALLSAVPEVIEAGGHSDRKTISIGEIGSATQLPSGCRFHPRCHRARALGSGGEVPAVCSNVEPALQAGADGRLVACHFAAGTNASIDVGIR